MSNDNNALKDAMVDAYLRIVSQIVTYLGPIERTAHNVLAGPCNRKTFLLLGLHLADLIWTWQSMDGAARTEALAKTGGFVAHEVLSPFALQLAADLDEVERKRIAEAN